MNAFFVDNHYRFLNEEMGYNVYTQLMTPRQASMVIDNAVVPPLTPTTAATPWSYILNEADY